MSFGPHIDGPWIVGSADAETVMEVLHTTAVYSGGGWYGAHCWSCRKPLPSGIPVGLVKEYPAYATEKMDARRVEDAEPVTFRHRTPAVGGTSFVFTAEGDVGWDADANLILFLERHMGASDWRLSHGDPFPSWVLVDDGAIVAIVAPVRRNDREADPAVAPHSAGEGRA